MRPEQPGIPSDDRIRLMFDHSGCRYDEDMHEEILVLAKEVRADALSEAWKKLCEVMEPVYEANAIACFDEPDEARSIETAKIIDAVHPFEEWLSRALLTRSMKVVDGDRPPEMVVAEDLAP